MKLRYFLLSLAAYLFFIVGVVIGTNKFDAARIRSKEDGQKLHERETRNMWNTVSPLINKLTDDACKLTGGVEIVTSDGYWANGSTLIYKIEPNAKDEERNCISGLRNVYYARCYEWRYTKDSNQIRATRDVPLHTFSCIPESQIEIPYMDERLAVSGIGEIVETKIEN